MLSSVDAMRATPGAQGPEWLRTWWPDLAGAALTLIIGGYEIARLDRMATGPSFGLLLVLGVAAAVALTRPLPGAALALLWIIGVAQLTGGTSALLVQVTVVYVAFGLARWGSAATVVSSGLSIPVAAAVGAAYGYLVPQSLGELPDRLPVPQVAERTGVSWPMLAAIVVLLLLVVPWLVGLTVRLGSRASQARVSQVAAEEEAARAHRETEQAREIASLREEQARLARDVHDVVGHSLAVILAQAESAQFLADDDPSALKQTAATIASAARSSLQDVRQVLAGPQVGSAGSFAELIDGVRAGGHEVVVTEVGVPVPLPDDLETVAHRVVQEMLTNAIKHGRRDRPVLVERHWPTGAGEEDLRVEVQNAVDDGAVAPTRPMPGSPGGGAGPGAPGSGTGPGAPGSGTGPGSPGGGAGSPGAAGQGLAGMRRRLAAVGGKLDVRQRDSLGGPIFAAVAWVPVRHREQWGEQ